MCKKKTCFIMLTIINEKQKEKQSYKYLALFLSINTTPSASNYKVMYKEKCKFVKWKEKLEIFDKDKKSNKINKRTEKNPTIWKVISRIR